MEPHGRLFRVAIHCWGCRIATLLCPTCRTTLSRSVPEGVPIPTIGHTDCDSCGARIHLQITGPAGEHPLEHGPDTDRDSHRDLGAVEFLERCLISQPTTPATRAGKVHGLDSSTQRWLQQHLRGPHAAAQQRNTWASCSVVIADWQQPAIPASVAAASYRRLLNLEPFRANRKGPVLYSAGELIGVLTELGRPIPDGIRTHCPDLWALHLELQASFARARPVDD